MSPDRAALPVEPAVLRSHRPVLVVVRDVALTVMAVLVSVVCALLVYAAVAVGAAFLQQADHPAETSPVPGVSCSPMPDFPC